MLLYLGHAESGYPEDHRPQADHSFRRCVHGELRHRIGSTDKCPGGLDVLSRDYSPPPRGPCFVCTFWIGLFVGALAFGERCILTG